MNYGAGDIFMLVGALGLFLYGMTAMSGALTRLAGNRMRSILASMTSNRVLAVLTGFLITAVIQSSSATTLMVVSFVHASLLTLTEAVGVILGAHIGTTVTAWLITLLGFSVDMSIIALPLIALGFALTLSKRERIENWGHFVVGFALIFLGLEYLKESIPDLQSNPEMVGFVRSFTGMRYLSVLIFMVIGTVLTMILQSSSATMALTLLMTYQGWIPFDLAAAMVLGENIGTTVTANMAALVSNLNGRRAALVHFLTQVIKVLMVLVVFYPFLRGIGLLVEALGMASPFESAASVPVALSLFHTLFNVASVLVLIWFIPLIVRLVKRVLPERAEADEDMEKPKYLTPASLTYPQTAMRALLDESRRLYDNLVYMVIVHGLNAHRSDVESNVRLQEIVEEKRKPIDIDIDTIYYTKVKVIYSEIVAYATQIQTRFVMPQAEVERLHNILNANRSMVEIVKRMKSLNKNLVRFAKSENQHIRAEYNALRKMILKVVRLLHSYEAAEDTLQYEEQVRQLRLKSQKSDVLMSGTINELIRKNLITREMATSLMNDSADAIEICDKLITLSEILYGDRDTHLEEMPVARNLLEGSEPILSDEERDSLHRVQ